MELSDISMLKSNMCVCLFQFPYIININIIIIININCRSRTRWPGGLSVHLDLKLLVFFVKDFDCDTELVHVVTEDVTISRL